MQAPSRFAPVLFPTGRLVGTPAALVELTNVGASARGLITRHSQGDWSEMSIDDQESNRAAVIEGNRVFSAFAIRGRKFWVITEADRSSTTILLPEDY